MGGYVATIKDVFDSALIQTVTWSDLDFVDTNNLAPVPGVVGVVGTGLDVLADAFTNGMSAALVGANLPGISPRSLAAALNGLSVSSVQPETSPFVTSSQVPGSDLIQIDNATSVLLRIFQAGGLNLNDIANGMINDPNMLKTELDDLDGTPGNVEVFTTAQPWDSDPGNDLLFEVNVTDVVLDGVVDLDVLADVVNLGGQVAFTGQVDVNMTLDLNIAFGVDSNGFFIRTAGPLLPRLAITDLSVSGEAIGAGELGFLGVDVSEATLELDEGVELVFGLNDPDSNDFIRAGAPGACRPCGLILIHDSNRR